MTRAEALEIAKTVRADCMKARIDFMFGRTTSFNEADYGYKHGWYTIGDYNFNDDEITGIPYDHTQGGWAYL